MKGTIGDILVKVFGALVVVVGIAGLALPILPGWVLIFAGLSLMGEHRLYLWVRSWYHNRVGKRTGPVTQVSAPEETLKD